MPIPDDLLRMEMDATLAQAQRALARTAAPKTAGPQGDAIVIGNPTEPLYVFDPSSIESITLVTAVDVVGAELSVDQFTPTVLYITAKIMRLWAPKGYQGLKCSDGRIFAYHVPRLDLRTLPYGTQVRYYRDSKLVGKYYSLNVDRTARDFFKINSVSPIGLLGKTNHMGGVYTGESFLQVATEIIGGVVPFSCGPEAANLKVLGHLPIASRRDNLHQLLMAYGVSVLRDSNGDIVLDYLSDGAPKAVPDERIYYGGSIDYSTPCTGVEITEHSYSMIDTTEAVTLFDNTDAVAAANNTMVTFDQAPVFGLDTTGSLRIISSGVNYAVVTGIGTLTGKPYNHTTQIIALTATDADQREANVVRVTDATLVNLTNSHNVAQRVMDYYSSAKTISAAISLEGEAAGDRVALSDPFGEASVGFLQRLEINVSSNLKANCTIVTDYTPHHERPNFTHVDILTEEVDYVVPEGVHLIRAVMIQGGQGGSKGNPGQPGQPNKRMSINDNTGDRHETGIASLAALGGEGGEPGTPGAGGKVFVVDIDVTPGQIIHAKPGLGGKGGLFADAAGVGEEGTHSTFGQFTSADGVTYANGWVETLSGNVYAAPGRAGIKGGSGSGCDPDDDINNPLVPGTPVTVDGQTWTPGESHREDMYTDSFGSHDQPGGYSYGALSGSQGGGAAYGANGRPGAAVPADVPTSQSPIYVGRYSGEDKDSLIVYIGQTRNGPDLWGGQGAKALPLPAETGIGKGGPAGNGGGGGGGAALAVATCTTNTGITGRNNRINNEPTQSAGPGGDGSDGSDGGPGAILVYSAPPENTTEEETP